MVYKDYLIRKLKIVSSTRLEASRRMYYLKVISTISLLMFSVAIIGLNLLVFINTDNKVFNNFITVITVILSTFALALTAVVNQMEYNERRIDFLNCGNKINELLEIILANNEKDIPKQDRCKYLEKYKIIIYSCKYNPSQLDFLRATTRDSYVNSLNMMLSECNKLKRTCWYYQIWLLIRCYVFDSSVIYILFIVASIASLILVPIII